MVETEYGIRDSYLFTIRKLYLRRIEDRADDVETVERSALGFQWGKDNWGLGGVELAAC